MANQKRKMQTAPPAANRNESDGSDYEVEWQVKPTPPKKVTKADLFPLPSQVERNLQKRTRGRKESSSDESDVEDAEGLPTLTTEQVAAILHTVKNNKRFVLMVNNLNFTTAKEEIEQHFDKAGRVKGVRIPKRRSSGFAFVEMLDPVGFQKAFLLDGSYLDGRKISVNLSESGNKKSEERIKLLMKKNIEIRKLRKKNRANAKAAEISLVPVANTTPKKPVLDKFLDKPKVKMLSMKEAKKARKQVSLKAKIKHMAKKGIKA
ncbi:AGAP009179-PA-like protein [Anopheles sinensis]|uniref:AGAP009179-PA-like protein n=1 Tax=Anopheles sinensis TaxID=74873 RepID=A0A084VMX4_ANOSI|nr:AGAP009179-PA-like protein [Anopheles sinensis]